MVEGELLRRYCPKCKYHSINYKKKYKKLFRKTPTEFRSVVGEKICSNCRWKWQCANALTEYNKPPFNYEPLDNNKNYVKVCLNKMIEMKESLTIETTVNVVKLLL